LNESNIKHMLSLTVALQLLLATRVPGLCEP